MDVSLSVARGEVALISGVSGAGKTTLLSLIHGDLKFDHGSIKVCGHDLTRLRRSSIPELRRRVVLLPQEVRLLHGRTVRHNVAVPLLCAGIDKMTVDMRVTEVLALVHLEWATDRAVEQLSTGERRRVSMARAIATQPDVMLLDEPDAHLDAGRRDELCGILDELRARGTACLVTTNEAQLHEVGAYCGWRAFTLAEANVAEHVLSFRKRRVTETDAPPHVSWSRAGAAAKD
jgi:cell division transport system ATP-binding protein